MLDELFSSKARIEILKLFIFNPKDRFYQRQISLETKQPIRAVQREVEKLEKIGTTLAFKGRSHSLVKVEVSFIRTGILKSLKDKKVMKMSNKNHRNLTLKKLFGDEIIESTKKILSKKEIPLTYSALANIITAQYYNLSPSTVERYVKDCDIRKDPDGNPLGTSTKPIKKK